MEPKQPTVEERLRAAEAQLKADNARRQSATAESIVCFLILGAVLFLGVMYLVCR